MAQVDITVEQRARAAVASLSRFAPVTAAYIFGSQVEGGYVDFACALRSGIVLARIRIPPLRDAAHLSGRSDNVDFCDLVSFEVLPEYRSGGILYSCIEKITESTNTSV